MTTLPKNILVVGGGVSGCEMACAFNLLGSQVTVAELLPEILVNEDRLAVKGLKAAMEKRGVVFRTGVDISASPKELAAFDCVLVAIGRRVGEDRLGLKKLGIETTDRQPGSGRGFVKVNERMETSVEGVYAIGDLVGTTMLAHGAMAEGVCAVENIAGVSQVMEYSSVPRVIYTIPEIASVGLREEDLKKAGTPYRAGRFSYLANAKALCHEEEEGFAIVLTGTEGDSKGKVLGATIFGAHAPDLIQEVALVMKNGLAVTALIETVHAHPSLSEIVHEAAEDSVGMAIHKLGRRPVS